MLLNGAEWRWTQRAANNDSREHRDCKRLTIASTDFAIFVWAATTQNFSSLSMNSQRFSSILVDNTSINPSASSPQLQPFPIFKVNVEHPNVCLPSPQARPGTSKSRIRRAISVSNPCAIHNIPVVLTFSRTIPLAWDDPPVGEVL